MKRIGAILTAASMTLAGCTTNPPTSRPLFPVFEGRVSVIDGRTLWYPHLAQKVRLVDIDTCELPQWALTPEWDDRQRTKSPAPVACGPLAKAWLKRLIQDDPVRCVTAEIATDGTPLAFCSTRSSDLGREMLRAGWARVSTPRPLRADYVVYQQHAMASRYGMWKTYVLDMDEWRRKAVDKTLDRQPIADFNLLAERKREISPPFADARQCPARRDR